MQLSKLNTCFTSKNINQIALIARPAPPQNFIKRKPQNDSPR